MSGTTCSRTFEANTTSNEAVPSRPRSVTASRARASTPGAACSATPGQTSTATRRRATTLLIQWQYAAPNLEHIATGGHQGGQMRRHRSPDPGSSRVIDEVRGVVGRHGIAAASGHDGTRLPVDADSRGPAMLRSHADGRPRASRHRHAVRPRDVRSGLARGRRRGRRRAHARDQRHADESRATPPATSRTARSICGSTTSRGARSGTGRPVTREIPPGPHRIRVNNTLFNDTLSFTARPAEHVRVRCHNGMPRAGWLMLLFFHATYLLVKLEREA